MATTTAQLIITSTDLLSDSLSLSSIATLTTAGSATGLTGTEGLGRKKTGSTTEYTLFDASAATDDKAHKIYLKNLSTTATEYFEVQVGGVVIGRIYAGDWALIPWSADTTSDDADFKITPSTSASHTLEYMIIHE